MVDSVLVAMDNSPLSREALEFALDTFSDADVTVVHVAYPELDMLPADTSEVYEVDIDDLDGIGDETARSVFETIRDVADGRDISVTFLIGEADRRLVEYTDRGDFDHVVLGTHGREGLSRLLIGSVAEAVVRQTNVPTTLVR
ncbi:universal stress protein [Halorubrum trueperi]|uniref:Universal stress protein n=1 Tax=Halorubrum trueperi TaxID=2004704 RepID=A0ABD5UPN0_9EURY